MKKTNKILIICITILLIGICTAIVLLKNTSTSIDNLTTNVKSRISDIDWGNYTGSNLTLDKSIEITEEGAYTLTGTITDGLIKINTEGNVKLILNGVSVTNSSGPAIYIENANNVEIETVEGTTNTFIDGQSYSGYDEDVNACIFSKDDLILSGSGTLQVTSNNEDAIVSKDDLKITSGTYIIDAVDDGIRGKDSLEITGGTFTINAGGDTLKSTNSTEAEKGFILISNGNFDLTAKNDCIQAETKILIENGTFNLNTENDAVHSNNYIGIENGTFSISSGDDGIHADEELIIDGGTINIEKSYEGLEASKITINAGTIDVTASDDGINVAGGVDSSSMNRPGANNFSSNDNILTINGGTIHINATGDGLDANGNIYINGGYTTVDGPTNDGNGALDYDAEFKVTGGILIAAGSSGMAQGISTSSTQNGVLINFNSTQSANTKVTISDTNGNEIISYTPSKTFASIVISSNKILSNTTYNVLLNDTEYTTFTTSSTSVTVGNNGGMMQGGNMRDREVPNDQAQNGQDPHANGENRRGYR